MGTKMVGSQEREKKKTKNEDGSLKAKDSLPVSRGEGLTLSSECKKKKKKKKKKKSESNEASIEDAAVSSSLSEGNVDVNNAADKGEKKAKKKSGRYEVVSSSLSEGNVDVNNIADKNEKKDKKKRKLEHVNDEKESQVSGKKYKMCELREVLGETHMRIDDNLGLQKNVQVNSESEVRRDRKNNHKEKNRGGKTNTASSVFNSLNDNRREEVFEVQKGHESEDIANMNNREGRDCKKEKKKKQKKYDDGGGDTEVVKSVADGKDAGKEESIVVVQDKVESSTKEKKKKKKKLNVLEAASMQIMDETTGNQNSVIEGDGGNTSSIKNKEKKKKQKKYDDGSGDTEVVKSVANGKDAGREVSNEVVQDKVESSTKEKKKKKKKLNVLEAASMQIMAETTGNQNSVIEGDGGNTSSIKNKEKKKKQKKYDDDGGGGGGGDTEVVKSVAKGKDAGREESIEVVEDKVESSTKEKKKKKKKLNVVLDAASMQIMADTTGNQNSVIEGDGGNASSIKNKARDGKLKVNAEGGNKRKKKVKSLENRSKENSERVTQMEEDAETTRPSEKSLSKVTSKRVSFCEDVEIFPSSDGPSDEKAIGEDGLVRGKRFSLDEDEMVKEAVLNYINVHGLGADGLNMVLNCKKHPAIKHCWKEIGAALPWRPRESVYYRAHILFERDQNSSWTPEEYELIRKFHGKHGSDWKTLAEVLGKHRFHVKDTWRRIKLINMKKGKWSQDEYQSLFDSVNLDLRLKAFEERKTKHGMLRDNISWTAISEKLETRTDALCCQKWYDQLTSPMVAEGKWLDTDDYWLLMELYDLDACCMEDVDWDNLLEHRSGDLSRKRWNQMVKHLGDHRNKSFADHVDILINRYCPDVLEAREAYKSKPAVP